MSLREYILARSIPIHSCDNKWCVNPDHLSLGTDATNSDDKHRKGRANLAGRVFSPHPGRKLTEAQVAEIRASHESIARLATQHGVSHRAVWAVRRGLHYKSESA